MTKLHYVNALNPDSDHINTDPNHIFTNNHVSPIQASPTDVSFNHTSPNHKGNNHHCVYLRLSNLVLLPSQTWMINIHNIYAHMNVFNVMVSQKSK